MGRSSRAGEPFCFDSSATQTLKQVAAEYPNVKLLALGQTVFWDEPVKATVRRALDDLELPVTMLLGIHDTDYFSKLPKNSPRSDDYQILPHNDGSTRDLWTSAGEISQLFGSETVITREQFAQHRVNFDRAAKDFPGGKEALLEKMSEAWGWRGLVSPHKNDPRVTAELPLAELAGPLQELLRWATTGTAHSIGDPARRLEAAAVAENLIGMVAASTAEHPDWTLSDFYQDALPKLYEMLLGYPPENVFPTSTVNLLNLTSDTASLPRFKLLDLFLQPESRPICERAYNESLEGGAMYELARFGPGALPFDLVVPGRGRGTLRVTEKYVVVMTPRPMFFSLREPIRSVAHLAAWIESALGNRVVVTGKAITLVSMLAHEFMFLFHEHGSNYVFRTRQMNDSLKASGIDFAQHPILRVQYDTWGSLAAVPIPLRLPDHLAAAFVTDQVSAPEFAQRWKSIVEDRKVLLVEFKELRGQRALIDALSNRCSECWAQLAHEYSQLEVQLREFETELTQIAEQIREQFGRWRAARVEYSRLEGAKGEDFRATVRPLQDRMALGESFLEADIQTQIERRTSEFDAMLNDLRSEIRAARSGIADLRRRRLDRVRSPEVLAKHEARRKIARRAELERLNWVRDAILTSEGLVRTDFRPTAWWLPMLSPDGAWFKRLAETTQMYLEPLYS